MLEINKWKDFKLIELFEIENNKGIEIINLKKAKGKTPVISTSKKNNGIVAMGENDEELTIKGNCLTIAKNGEPGVVFYQPIDFMITSDILVLRFKEKFNIWRGLFFKIILELEKFKYSYGRKINLKRLRETKIRIPIDENKDIDFENIEKFIKSLNYSNSIKKIDVNSFLKPNLDFNIDFSNWKFFKLSNIFFISKTKNVNANDVKKGFEINYVTRTDQNNGIGKKTSRDYPNDYINKKNTLTIGGENATCFYQPNDYITGNNITKLESKNFKLNIWRGIFFAMIINLEKFKYSYGRAFNLSRVKNTLIKLPINKKKEIDFVFIENLIKKTPFSSNLFINKTPI